MPHSAVISNDKSNFSTVPDGLRFDSSVQTPLVSAGEKQVLSLESPTKTLYMNAAQGVKITSIANDMKINSLYNIDMVSKKGKVSFVKWTFYLVQNFVRSEFLSLDMYQDALNGCGTYFELNEEFSFPYK